MTFNSRLAGRVAISIFVLIVACVLAFFHFARSHHASKDGGSHNTVSPELGRIVVTISSTGRVSARSTVTVGSQVSGEISEVKADFNQKVKTGQIIATINPARYSAQLNSTTAALAGAQASLQRALEHSQQVGKDLERAEELAGKQLISRSDLEERRDEISESALQLRAARASIKGLEAAVTSSRYDMEQTVIRSPVDGVILDRMVEPGQTVAASFQTPILFRIAEDLSKMKIELAVDEADIGQIGDGNQVQFTVDAFPERTFFGAVIQKRIAPTIQGNNATYPVVVSVDNIDGVLIPGMLADATINVAERNRALTLPREYLDSSGEGGRKPSFKDIQKALKVNIQALELSKIQQSVFEKASKIELPETAKQESVPAELVKFFGAAVASNIIIIDDASSDPETAIKNDRLRRLQKKFVEFRSTLNRNQQSRWDQLLNDLVESNFASVLVKVGSDVAKGTVMVGISDETSTQVLSGIGLKDEVQRPESSGQ